MTKEKIARINELAHKSTGKRKGDEVAQVYVRIPETGGVVPIKELKGFRPSQSAQSGTGM